jgi:hypothetical protein
MPLDARSATNDQPIAPRTPTGSKVSANRGRYGPYSRAISRGAIGELDGNTREAKFIKTYERMLTEHVGGRPSAVQRALITRASRLALHLELWDERTLPNGGAVSATGHNHYIQWQNALGRSLKQLGLEPRAAPAMTLEDYSKILDERRRARGDHDEEAA